MLENFRELFCISIILIKGSEHYIFLHFLTMLFIKCNTFIFCNSKFGTCFSSTRFAENNEYNAVRETFFLSLILYL